jgi:hypothetical protein
VAGTELIHDITLASPSPSPPPVTPPVGEHAALVEEE